MSVHIDREYDLVRLMAEAAAKWTNPQKGNEVSTVARFYNTIAAALRRKPNATGINMHPDTWQWLMDEVNKGGGKPLKVPPGKPHVPAKAVGTMHGVPVYVDSAVPKGGYTIDPQALGSQ